MRDSVQRGQVPGQVTASDVSALPELLKRSALGDEAAFAELYVIAAPRLFGMAVRVLGQHTHAEEVTQEALMTIWTTCARFDPDRGSAMSWMLTIAHRRAVDRVRQSAASSRRDAAWVADLDLDERQNSSDAAAVVVETVAVRAALRTLPQKQKTAVFLAYFGGHTYVEVAEALGVPQSTVKSRIHAGLRTLSDALTAPGDAALHPA